MDGYEACQGLRASRWGSTEGPCDPQSSFTLHLCEDFEGGLVLGAFEEPESKTVRCNWENTSTVEEVLLQRRKAPHRITKHPHRLDGRERLGGVVSNVLSEKQLSIKVEP